MNKWMPNLEGIKKFMLQRAYQLSINSGVIGFGTLVYRNKIFMEQ